MAASKIVLSIDTSDTLQANSLVELAKSNHGSVVKFGLEFATKFGWNACSELAKQHSIDWIADAKLDDIPHTVQMAIRNLRSLDVPPIGITVHLKAGIATIEAAQKEAGNAIIFGVTELTSITEAETRHLFGKDRRELVTTLLARAKKAGVLGAVISGNEISIAKGLGLKTLVPGIRSSKADKDDQQNVITPKQALKSGADYIVIGREITQSSDPDASYRSILATVLL
jgi:orotidine-5'-phosphate decarboxylase